jgi:CRP/FNR family transcriptional regulator, cyclic AMP receptor protein
VARRAGADEPLPLVIVVPPGREVIRQGEPYADAWVVRTGALLMEVVDRDGHALALDVLGPGDLVGGPPDAIADASARALLTSRLLAANADALRTGLERRARRVTGLASSLAWDRLAVRVAGRLDDLARRFGRPVPRGRQVALPLTQEHLAALTGSTRESVNRALSDLAEAGRLERRAGRYVVGSEAIGPGGSYPSDWRSAREQELQ